MFAQDFVRRWRKRHSRVCPLPLSHIQQARVMQRLSDSITPDAEPITFAIYTASVPSADVESAIRAAAMDEELPTNPCVLSDAMRVMLYTLREPGM